MIDYEAVNYFFQVWSIIGVFSIFAGISVILYAFERTIRLFIDYYRKKKLDISVNK